MKIANITVAAAVLSFIGGAYSAAVVDDQAVTKKKSSSSRSNFLPSFPGETLLHMFSTIEDNNRRIQAATRKLESHITTNTAAALFPKSAKDGKAAIAKSSKEASTKSSNLFDTAPKSSKEVKSSKGGDGAAASCDAIQAKLDVCEAAANVPHWLFVQMADMCALIDNGDGTYSLESSKFHPDTEIFSDRPFQLEETQSTEEWFEGFDEQFDDGKGAPNAALTIVDDDTSKDVVVSVFAEAYTKWDVYGYKLKQSASQESVMSLEELMGGEDSVVFDHCSMFIDA